MLKQLKWVALLQCVTLLRQLAVVAIDLEQRTMITHIWEVGVDSMKIPAGSLLESPKFVSHNGTRTESWYLRLYPNGSGSSKGWVSLYLVYVSDPPVATTPKVEVFIDNKEEIDIIRKWSSSTYEKLEDSYGWSEFAKPEVLLDSNNGFIFNGKIRFGARIASDHQIMDESENAEITYIWGVGAQTMELTGEMFVESPKFNTFRISETRGQFVEESWNIRVYPQGTTAFNESDPSEKKLAMYLVYDGDAPVTPSVGYLILNSKPENIIRYWASKTYAKNGDSRGYNDLITKDRLLDPSQGFVDKDGLILFAVRVPTSYASPKKETSVTVLNTWEVGVETIKSMANGVSVESPKYTIWNGTEEEEWFLRLYPNGFMKENKGVMSLYLVNSKGAPTKAKAEVMILNDADELTLRRWYKEPYEAEGESNGYHRVAIPTMLTDPSKGFIYDGNKIRIGIRMHTTPPTKTTTKQKYATFIWEVSVRTMQNGGQHESPKYMVKGPYGQDSWHLRLFPQGYTAENKGYVSLYLVYGGRFTSEPRAEIFAVNQKDHDTVRKWTTSKWDRFGESIGFSRFISTDHILDPSKGFVNNNRVTFGLKIPIESVATDAGEVCPVCNFRCPVCKQSPAPAPTPHPVTAPPLQPPPSNPAISQPAVAPASSCPPVAHPANVDTSSDLTRGTTNSSKLSVWKNLRIKVGDTEVHVEEITTSQALQQLVNSLSRGTGSSAKPGQNKTTLEVVFNDLK